MSCIVSSRRCTQAVLQNFGLAPFRGILTSDAFRHAGEQGGCAPQRQRALIPEVVAWLMMYVGLQTTSMTQGLCQAWGQVRAVCPWLRAGCVTEEAFCQARRRLTVRFWRTLWNRLQDQFGQRFEDALRWKGRLRLLAIDGTDVNLPNMPAVVRWFGKHRVGKRQAKRPQAKLVALCSVLTGFCFDFKFIAQRFSEHQALQHLIRRLRDCDLVLADRGFFSLCRHMANLNAWGPLSHAFVRPASP
jgi:hypothetical protein